MGLPVANSTKPRAIRTTPNPMPARAARTEARRRSPVPLHSPARRMRPPSSGAAGMRLNPARRRLICHSHEHDAHDQAVGPGLLEQGLRGREHARQGDARARADRRDGEVGSGIVRLAFELGNATEEPQRDRAHPDPVAPRHDRVRALVGEQRYEEQRRREDRRHPVPGGCPPP